MKHSIVKRSILLMAVLCLLLTACGRNKPKQDTADPTDLVQTETADSTESVQKETTAQEPEETLESEPAETEENAQRMPWEADGAKQPEEYTLEEYEGLTADQRKAFRNYLGSAGYAAWLEQAEEAIEPEEIPWNKSGAKQPKDYSWAEYQALSEKQKKAFMEHLGPQGLENWLEKTQNSQTANPWEQPGAKKPNQYSWAEYQALTQKQKEAFAAYLGSAGFQSWLNGGQVVNDVHPWEKPGAKRADRYTWEEYEALTSAQKKAFRNHLGTGGFEAWLEKVQEEESPWEESGAKQPGDYTWEEYLALNATQKNAFQEYLGARGYEQWLEKVLDQDADMPWKEPDAKQPRDYTWKDYQNLTEAQQVAFREHLGKNATLTWLRTITELPWEKPKAKQPEEYTLKEYEDLKDPQQLAFRVWMGEAEFDVWLLDAQNPPEANPWEKAGAKQPQEYTLKEYELLTAAQQMAFQRHMGVQGFESWLKKFQSSQERNPWDTPGAKRPQDYSLAEYEALTKAQQTAFQNYLGAQEYQAWLSKVQSAQETNPWEKPGAKQPAEYTMAEFEALTAGQQMAFQNYLGEKDFEAWLNAAQNPQEPNPWDEPGAKQPQDYTMAEFEALTAGQQVAFQNYLGSDAFNAWLEKTQNQPVKNPWDEPGAKQPADYTMAEFEALTTAQQMAFQNYLGQADFEAWLSKVEDRPESNPWESPGAKQPEEYTMEEFETLTAAQQMAFQNYLGAEGFEAWLNRVTG